MLIGRAPSASIRLSSPVQFESKSAQVGQRVLSNPGVVLTDPRSEHDRVSTAEHGEIRADVLAEPVAVDLERRPRPLIAIVDRGLEITEVVMPASPWRPDR